jgi:hypothetical protein
MMLFLHLRLLIILFLQPTSELVFKIRLSYHFGRLLNLDSARGSVEHKMVGTQCSLSYLILINLITRNQDT